MISGMTVTILRPGPSVIDRFGNEIPGEEVAIAINDVIIAPGATADLEASRPDGVTVAYTLHMPVFGIEDLEGCEVMLPAPYGGPYRVVGNPTRYMPENMPPRFKGYMPVEVEAAHG